MLLNKPAVCARAAVPAGPGLPPMLLCLALTAAFPASAAAAGPDLTALSLEQLLEVKVVGAAKYEQRQSEVAAAVSVITRAEIQAFGWRTLAQALGSLPGVHTTYDRQYTYLGARGFGLPGDLTARLLITVNGNRVNDPVYDGGPVGRDLPIDLDLVERIEFIPGPGGAVYGQNAMFGVVNIVTRSGGAVGGTEVAAAHQHPQHLREGRASWGGTIGNDTTVLLSASTMRARGEDRYFEYGESGLAGVATGLDAERSHSLFAQFKGTGWSVDLVHGDRGKIDPTAAFFSDPLTSGHVQHDRYTLVQLQVQDSFAEDTLDLSARVFAGRYRYDGTFNYDTPVSFPALGDWRGLELRAVSTVFAGHRLMVGLEAQDNTRTDQLTLDLAEPDNSYAIERSGHRVGLYAQDEWRISETLTTLLGLRLDRNGRVGTQSSPRVALIWQAQPATTIKALAGRAFRAPNVYERDFEDVYSSTSNPGLRSERIGTLELVAEHRAGPDLALRASAYQWTMRDIIVLGVDPLSELAQYQSGDPIRARGLELSADKTWRSGARARGNVSLQDLAYVNGTPLPNAPRLLGRFALTAPLPWAGLHAGWELRYDSRRLSLDGTHLGSQVTSGLNLSSRALAPGLEISLRVDNLLNKRHAHPGSDINWQNALEQDGRSLRLRATYRF